MAIQRGVDSPTRELALFAGAGGGILGGHLLGWRTVCAVEWDPYAASVLVARQNDGMLAPFPIWDDVQTFDGRPWRGRVDVVSGGFPCQDISCAGKGAGIDGERSGMWAEMARIIGEVRPRYAFIENSPMLTSRGLDRVLTDLAAIGFDAEWGTLSAADVGAPHKRDRIWVLARNMGDTYNDGQASTEVTRGASEGGDTRAPRQEQAREFTRPSKQYGEVADTSKLQRDGGDHHARIGLERKSFSKSGDGRWAKAVANPNSTQRTRLPSRADEEKPVIRVGSQYQIGVDRRQELVNPNSKRCKELDASRITESEIWFSWRFNGDRNAIRWPPEPDVGRVADGVAARVDRLKAIGNGQVPRVAAIAFEQLRARLEREWRQ